MTTEAHTLPPAVLNYSTAFESAALVQFIPSKLMLTAVVESQGSQAWGPLAVGGACLASSLEGGHQGSLGEACLGASAQQPYAC